MPRADDAFVEDEKWDRYVLADIGHGDDWRRTFGEFDPAALWSMLAAAACDAGVVDVHDLGPLGVTCRVQISLTVNERTASVRTVWHYETEETAPRLVTAFPET
jgi:hypothetical protein